MSIESWSSDHIEEFFNKLFERGDGFLKAERKDNMILIKSSSCTHHTFTLEQLRHVARDIQCEHEEDNQ